MTKDFCVCIFISIYIMRLYTNLHTVYTILNVINDISTWTDIYIRSGDGGGDGGGGDDGSWFHES